MEVRSKFIQEHGIVAWRELESKPTRLKREHAAREQDAVEQQRKKAAREQHWQQKRKQEQQRKKAAHEQQQREQQREQHRKKRDTRAIALINNRLTQEGNIAFNGAVQNWDKEKVCVSTAKGASEQFTAFIKICNEVYEVNEIALFLRKELYPNITLNELARDDIQYRKIYKAVDNRLRKKAVLHRNFDKQTSTQRSSPEEALQKAYEVLMKCGSTHEKAMQIARKGIENWDDFVHPVDVK